MKSTAQQKILIIEDDTEIQELMTAFFRPKNFSVLIYDDATVALKDIEHNKVECDVILTDLKLPNISGIEFTKKIKELGIPTPIILMTAHKSVDIAIEAIEAGAYDFLIKPINFQQLLISIERALHFCKISQENSTLKTAVQIKDGSNIDGIIGKSQGFRQALDLAKRVSTSTANVLVTGESGTGKEIIAKSIHSMGPRKNEPFIAINCSAIPENLLESELFGHAKGAFTGASDKKIGLFEEAENGTLFLDEIGDLTLSLQAKLLRVLQERKIKRIGENQFRPINTRIIAATHKDLRKEILQGNFREDLFFRLNVIPIHIPPLRERQEDITPLAEFFLKKFAALNNSKVKGFAKSAVEKLLSNPWKGNVRELENAIERAVVLCTSDVLSAEDFFGSEDLSPVTAERNSFEFSLEALTQDRILSVDEMVKHYIQHVLKKNNGAKEKTAKDLSIDRKTLYRKLQEIENPAFI